MNVLKMVSEITLKMQSNVTCVCVNRMWQLTVRPLSHRQYFACDYETITECLWFENITLRSANLDSYILKSQKNCNIAILPKFKK